MLLPGGSEAPNADIVIRDYKADQIALARASARNRAEADRKEADFEAYWEGTRKTREDSMTAEGERQIKEQEARKKAGTGEDFLKDAWDATLGNIPGLKWDKIKTGFDRTFGNPPKPSVPDINLALPKFDTYTAQRNAADYKAGNAELQAASFGRANFGSGSVSEVKGLKEFSDSFGGGIDRARMAYTLPKFDMPSLDMFGGPQRPKEFFEL